MNPIVQRAQPQVYEDSYRRNGDFDDTVAVITHYSDNSS